MGALDPELVALMVDTITVAPATGRTASGTATFGAPVSLTCKVDWKRQVYPSATGRDVVGRGIVYLPAVHPEITTEDRVTLPDGSSPPLLGVQTFDDEAGPCYTTLIFQ